MSTEKTDTTSSANDAASSPEATELEDNVKTVEVTEAELSDLGELLSKFHTVLLGHEHRLLEHEGRISSLEGAKPLKLEIPRGRSR